MEQIRGLFHKFYFFNVSNAQASFSLYPKSSNISKEYLDKAGNVRCVGKIIEVTKATPLELKGEWVQTNYGWEFHFQEVEFYTPEEYEMISFIENLGTRISSRHTRKILQVCPNLFTAVSEPNSDNKISRDSKVDILSVRRLTSKIRSMKTTAEVFKILDKYNGTYEQVLKICSKYPENGDIMLRRNAYEILKNVNVSFPMIDRIALDNGVDTLAESRIQAILHWCIKSETNKGHTFIKIDDICKSVQRNFGEVPKAAILAALKNHPNIIKEPNHEDYYYEKRMYKDEVLAAREFVRLMYTRKAIGYYPDIIKKIEENLGHPLGKQQRTAFHLCKETGIKDLRGKPGSGKTTTLCVLLQYLEEAFERKYGRKPKIVLCAPSGRAAQRMKETTGRDALTCHKVLNFMPFGNSVYFKDANDPIDADIIVVDEVSMLGVGLFGKLLAATKSGSLVMLIGDTNQLQSVEPGSVLADIIKCGYVPGCYLTEVFRQSKESLINKNANCIIDGDPNLTVGDDFEMYETDNEHCQELMLSVVQKLIQEAGDKNKVQVLAPVRKGSCGTREGNNILQTIFNPQKGGIWYGGRNYKVGDRVIMLQNNYALNYFNGDIGYIVGISEAGMDIRIGEETVTLPKDRYTDVDLAYNCTIHKSQGSEYEYLVVVLQEDAGGMLDRNLFYTAVTRGKKKVAVVYEKTPTFDAVRKSILTKSTVQRNSLLVERINNEFQKLA